jgi:hypothetical protein
VRAAVLADIASPFGISTIALGIAIAGLGTVMLFDEGLERWLRQWWTITTAD